MNPVVYIYTSNDGKIKVVVTFETVPNKSYQFLESIDFDNSKEDTEALPLKREVRKSSDIYICLFYLVCACLSHLESP